MESHPCKLRIFVWKNLCMYCIVFIVCILETHVRNESEIYKCFECATYDITSDVMSLPIRFVPKFWKHLPECHPESHPIIFLIAEVYYDLGKNLIPYSNAELMSFHDCNAKIDRSSLRVCYMLKMPSSPSEVSVVLLRYWALPASFN